MPSPAPRIPPSSPHTLATALYPRVVRSERSSPDASLHALVDEHRPKTEALTVVNDPWRKMSEMDLKSASRRILPVARASLDSPNSIDPWVRNPASRAVSRDELRVRRGKLERTAAVCDACGPAGCECRRAARAAQCTCRTPRLPARAHSDDEDRPRRLYKSASQKIICTSVEREPPAAPADPLLETTC